MRRRQLNNQDTRSQNITAEPLTEGIEKKFRKFTAAETLRIALARQELIARGLNERQIAERLAGEMGLPEAYIHRKIIKMKFSGKMQKNMNSPERRDFTEEENERMKQRRDELIAQGMGSKRIARELSKETGRDFKVIWVKLRRWEKRGAVSDNPNKAQPGAYTPEEIERIRSRRDELISEGTKDERICKIVAHEMGRSQWSISGQVKRLMASGGFPANPNKRNRRGDAEMRMAIAIWRKLASEGLMDPQIVRAISEQTGAPRYSVAYSMRAARRSGRIPENPNKRLGKPEPEKQTGRRIPRNETQVDKQKRRPVPGKPDRHMQHFTKEEETAVVLRRGALITEGLTDMEIGRLIAAEYDRTCRGLAAFIRAKVRKGEIPENTNTPRHFGKKEVELIISKRAELIALGMNDTRVSCALAAELGVSTPRSVEGKIRELVRSGLLEKNPNSGVERADSDKVREIIRMRERFVSEGWYDEAICREISRITGRPVDGVRSIIYSHIRDGRLSANPNKNKSSFTPEQAATLARKREMLIKEGCTDSEIGKLLSGEFGKKGHTLSERMRLLVKKGALPPNPNKMRKKAGRAKHFYRKMGDDALVDYAREICRRIGAIKGQDLKDADSGLYEELRKRKLLPLLFSVRRPGHISGSELLSGLRQAADAMAEFGNVGKD